MATVATVEAWVRAQARNYDQDCAGFLFTLARLFGTAPVVYTSAENARAHSPISGTNMNAASAGAVGFWNVAMPSGHCMVSLGDGRWLGATRHVTTMWGVNTGTVTSADYIRLSGARGSFGWSYGYGADTIPISTTGLASVGAPVPVPPPVIPPHYQGAEMQLVYSTLGDQHYLAQLIGPNGVVDSIDNQLGWNGVQPLVNNPLYLIYVQLFDPRPGVNNPILTKAQNDLLTERMASNWAKPPVASSGGSVDLSGVLAAEAATLAAVKGIPLPPTKFIAG